MRKRVIKTKAIIFDMDGVITNTMPDHFRAWQSALKGEGVHATHEDIYSREGQRGLTSVGEIFKKYGKLHTLKTAQSILKRKEAIFKRIDRVRFIAGSRDFVKRLHKTGFRLALVTGTSRHEMERVLPQHIYRCFDVSVTGCEVRNGKPNPEPYLNAMRKMKLKKSEAVVIENAPFGIRSAKKAGLRCLAIETSLSREYLKEADDVFTSFKELKKRTEFHYV